MTIRHNESDDAHSNYFARLEEGIGHRGSSFTDIDAVSHDGRTARFLFREFKGAREILSDGQKRVLMGLAELPRVTCWLVRRQPDNRLLVVEFHRGGIVTLPAEVSEDEYRALYRAWWDQHTGLDRL